MLGQSGCCKLVLFMIDKTLNSQTIKSYQHWVPIVLGIMFVLLSACPIACGLLLAELMLAPELHRSAISPDGTWSVQIYFCPGVDVIAEIRDKDGLLLSRSTIAASLDSRFDAETRFPQLICTNHRAYLGRPCDRKRARHGACWKVIYGPSEISAQEGLERWPR